VNEPPANLNRPAGLNEWRIGRDKFDSKALLDFVRQADTFDRQGNMEEIRGDDGQSYHFHLVQHSVVPWTEEALQTMHMASHIFGSRPA